MSAATGKVYSLPEPAVAGRLGFAAAPIFALMAGISAAGSPGMTMCSATIVPINDMALMYLLMSFFHLPPWLKLLSARSQRRNNPVTRTEGD